MYILIIVAIVVLVVTYNNSGRASDTLTFNKLAEQIQAGQVSALVIDNDTITVKYIDQQRPDAESRKDSDGPLFEQLLAIGVTPEQLATISKIEFARPAITAAC